MELIGVIINILAKNSKNIVIGAGAAAAGVAAGVVIAKKADDKAIQAEKKISFEHGVRKGVVIGTAASQELYENSLCATAALAYYVAKADGKVTLKEKHQINAVLSPIIQDPNASDAIKMRLKAIEKDNEIDFGKVTLYLDKLNLDTVVSLRDTICSMHQDKKRTPSEQEVINEIELYIHTRAGLSQKSIGIDASKYALIDLEKEREAYYLGLVPEAKIASAVEEYSLKMRMLDYAFSNKTKLNQKEIGLLMTATCLQCLRIYLVNYLTKEEKAGNKNKKERALHDLQEKVLAKFDNGIQEKRRKYYNPLNEIILNRGVPYDTTRFAAAQKPIFKGANHRFATLGHDPIIGLFFGTINIMTNTFTSIGDGLPIPVTYHVVYDALGKNPSIGEQASFITALDSSIKRSKDDLKPLCAAFIKQLIHIHTDMYTPAGIQLPGANLVLSNDTAERLTSFISTGDVIKIGASAGIDILINKMIEMLHGCMILDASSEIDDKSNQVKTRKIILYSNAMASSSSIVAAAITQNYKNLDWGGVIVLLSRLFTDLNFIYDIKRDFIRTGLGELQ